MNKVIDTTTISNLAEEASLRIDIERQFNIPDLARLLRSAYYHGYRDALLEQKYPPTTSLKDNPMTDDQIKHMVNRFLGWRLPENFQPDAGISFNPEYNVAQGKPPARYQPIGTNLFTADQAEAMIRYLIEGLPEPKA
jgi:hypothetical protein